MTPGRQFNPADSGYVEVPQRIAEFRAKHPGGSLQSEIIDLPAPFVEKFVAVRAYAYRSMDDIRPGVGLAWEPFPGRTPYTKDSELQNAETSAWGRAIVAVLAADAKRGIASAEDVRNRQADVAGTGEASSGNDVAGPPAPAANVAEGDVHGGGSVVEKHPPSVSPSSAASSEPFKPSYPGSEKSADGPDSSGGVERSEADTGTGGEAESGDGEASGNGSPPDPNGPSWRQQLSLALERAFPDKPGASNAWMKSATKRVGVEKLDDLTDPQWRGLLAEVETLAGANA